MATFNNGESGLSVRTKINNVLQHTDGTASELVINDAGADVNFRVESDTNANALFVDGGTGRVGIGTANPSYPLQINSATVSTVTVVAGASSEARLFLGDAANVAAGRIVYDNATDSLELFANDSERMRITSTGNVGIGTSSPTNSTGYGTLSLNGTTGGQIAFQTGTVGSAFIFHDGVNGNLNLFNSQAGNTIFSTNGFERMRIDSSGSVGIGETAPDYKLDVNGAIGFTPGASVTPVDNGDVVFELTNNTTLTVKAKGSDGVVRSATLTLA